VATQGCEQLAFLLRFSGAPLAALNTALHVEETCRVLRRCAEVYARQGFGTEGSEVQILSPRPIKRAIQGSVILTGPFPFNNRIATGRPSTNTRGAATSFIRCDMM
jgi:hypothetical protein